MNDGLIDVNLMSDHAAVAELSAEIGALGGMMICHGCRDVEALIAGVLIIEQDEEAWPLCGVCI